jgi:hypothetical protein
VLLGAGAQFGVLMPFGREHESEADHVGLIYMARAGYDPRESIRFWERMEQAAGPAAGVSLQSSLAWPSYPAVAKLDATGARGIPQSGAKLTRATPAGASVSCQPSGQKLVVFEILPVCQCRSQPVGTRTAFPRRLRDGVLPHRSSARSGRCEQTPAITSTIATANNLAGSRTILLHPGAICAECKDQPV